MYRACVTALLPLLGAELHARPTAEWVRSAVIYEINTRTFSATGDFHGVEARLPELEKLGVTVLWLMPIHPIGQLKRKGTLGSPYSIQDYYTIEPSYGQPAQAVSGGDLGVHGPHRGPRLDQSASDVKGHSHDRRRDQRPAGFSPCGSVRSPAGHGVAAGFAIDKRAGSPHSFRLRSSGEPLAGTSMDASASPTR